MTTLYQSTIDGEIRELDDALYASWVANGNPKAAAWVALPARPSPDHTWDGSQWTVDLVAIRTRKINAINAECRRRLIGRYGPAEEQVSRSLGVYGEVEQTAMTVGIAATVDAANAAQDAVLAATTYGAIEAVTVTWPAI